MRITRHQLRKIIQEASDAAEGAEGVGATAIRAFLIDELLVDNDELTLKDVLQQSEGAGFDSTEVEETIEELLDTGEIVDEDGMLVLP